MITCYIGSDRWGIRAPETLQFFCNEVLGLWIEKSCFSIFYSVAALLQRSGLVNRISWRHGLPGHQEGEFKRNCAFWELCQYLLVLVSGGTKQQDQLIMHAEVHHKEKVVRSFGHCRCDAPWCQAPMDMPLLSRTPSPAVGWMSYPHGCNGRSRTKEGPPWCLQRQTCSPVTSNFGAQF